MAQRLSRRAPARRGARFCAAAQTRRRRQVAPHRRRAALRDPVTGTVHIIGAGLAGLAAATALAPTQRVVVHEAARLAGGRCRSYFDPRSVSRSITAIICCSPAIMRRMPFSRGSARKTRSSGRTNAFSISRICRAAHDGRCIQTRDACPGGFLRATGACREARPATISTARNSCARTRMRRSRRRCAGAARPGTNSGSRFSSPR